MQKTQNKRNLMKKEEMVAALENNSLELSTPVWELEFHLWDKFSAKDLVLGEEYQRLTSSEQERTLYQNAEILISVAEELHFAAITLPNVYWEIGPGVPAYYWLTEEAIYKLAQILKQLGPEELMLVGNCSALLGMPFGEDYIPFSYKLFDAPEEVEIMAKQKLREGLLKAKRFRDCGVEIGLSTTDLADNHSTFMNPRQLERYVWPYLSSWAQHLKDLGLYSILHSDGNLRKCLDIIANSGVNALQGIDPTAGMLMSVTKERIGQKICLCGNVDCALLVSGSPEEIYHSTADLIKSMKNEGGYVLGASNAVQREVPVENYRALIQAWDDFGKN